MNVPTNVRESRELKRLRRRLKKRLSQQDEKITQDAVNQMSNLIKILAERKNKSKLDLKKRTITVFDPTKTPAKETPSMNRLRNFIKKDYFPQ